MRHWRYRCSDLTWGRGPALVFIPGLCDDQLSFVLPIARLKDHFRCVAYNLPSGQGDGAAWAATVMPIMSLICWRCSII